MEGSGDNPKLSGQSVRDIRWAFEQLVGADVVATALARLPDPVREAYGDASPLEWVDYDVVVDAHDAIAREAGTTMEALLEQAVPLAVERAFRTVWRVLVRFTSDAAMIARTPLFYSKTRSKGEMRSELLGPGVAMCELTGWPKVPPRDVRALTLSIETLLRLSAREEVVVTATKSPEGARFDIRWRP
ncbi:MAG: hypothetical protein AB7S26_01315 [Sandaracinaceae bacterium]